MRLIAVLFVFALVSASSIAQKPTTQREYYQLSVYHYNTPSQEQVLDKYLQQAFLPALHKKGIKNIGVFKPIANDTAKDRQIFVLVPFSRLEQVKEISDQLIKDKEYLTAGKDYIDAVYSEPPYQRMDVTLLYAFELAPKMNIPKLTSPKKDRVYEFRSYESATEAIYRNKVKMFNEGGEVALFNRLGFNAIFYGEVLAGSRMPNLMYMTSFENMDERNKHWKSFSDDAEWKVLSAKTEYKNNVSKIDIVLMRPAEYSDY